MITPETITTLQAQLENTEAELAKPEVYASDKAKGLVTAQRELQAKLELFLDYQKVAREIEEAKTLLLDPEMRDLATETLAELEPRLVELEKQVTIALIPTDPRDSKNAIIEIRAGAGGDESSIFAGDLARMYARYAETNGLKLSILSENQGTSGGYKEIIFSVEGDGAYGKLRYESGVHRVQRIPATESAGRIHTSTATVAVLPEAEEADIEIHQNDLRVDVFRSSGNGGQSVNTTDSAVRITHLPTGIVVTCQDEKSQLKNKLKAMGVLRARLLDEKLQAEAKEASDSRKAQIGTGDRSEKIRTYNYPQDRITDHRIGFTTHGIPKVLDGDLSELLDALQAAALQNALNNTNT